mgnify:CR=1 FL=1
MNRKRTAILLIGVLIIPAALCACSHERVLQITKLCEIK